MKAKMMQELSDVQLLNISGGFGCLCKPAPLGKIVQSGVDCEGYCCESWGSSSFCLFEDGPTPVMQVTLNKVPHECFYCGNDRGFYAFSQQHPEACLLY
ncbi:MAG: hypothetical protein KKE11_00125 [Gammaproteobacteria bacterium]|nr:hypothetical protein [Gammaproteobacteria bacterium]